MNTCAWCNKIKDKSNPKFKSHGICKPCAIKFESPDWHYNYETKKFDRREIKSND